MLFNASCNCSVLPTSNVLSPQRLFNFFSAASAAAEMGYYLI